jgi:hypothetical protein
MQLICSPVTLTLSDILISRLLSYIGAPLITQDTLNIFLTQHKFILIKLVPCTNRWHNILW